MTNEEFLESISEEGEIWKPVVGYEGRYAVSSFGRLVSLAKLIERPQGNYIQPPQIVKPRQNSKRTTHQSNGLYKNNQRTLCYRHRLVAEAFIPNPQQLPIVEHIDCDPTNNNVVNLRWTTQTGNMNNPITLKRISNAQKKRDFSMYYKQIVCIRPDNSVKIYPSMRDAQKDGFRQSLISQACHGAIKTHLKCKWMFLSDYKTSKSAMSKNS